MSHWARPLLGCPWSPGAEGPTAFYCWGLVRFVWLAQRGRELPPLPVGDDAEGFATLRRACAGFRIVAGPPEEWDIVEMLGPRGAHVGLMIRMSTGLVLLHADGYLKDGVPIGDVRAVELREAMAGGYGHIKLWREVA